MCKLLSPWTTHEAELEAKVLELQNGLEARRLAGLENTGAGLRKDVERLSSKNDDLADENRCVFGTFAAVPCAALHP